MIIIKLAAVVLITIVIVAAFVTAPPLATMNPCNITFYTSTRCDECVPLEARLDSLAEDWPLAITRVDVTSNPATYKHYGAWIPVLVFGDGTELTSPIDGKQLIDAVRANSQAALASRIFYFHVPMAQVGFLSFIVAAVGAILYLRKRRPEHDTVATTAAQLGLTFSVVAMITGSLWAKQAWGAYWNWDPRQSSLFILILFYGAFFALRQAVVQRDTRARLSAVYLIFGGAISPLMFFVLPRLLPSLHGDANQVVVASQPGSNMSGGVAAIFVTSIIGFICLYVWLLKLGVAVQRIQEETG
jgi:heme exporter protein C